MFKGTKAPCPECRGKLEASNRQILAVPFPGNEEGSYHEVYKCIKCKIDVVFLAKREWGGIS